MKRRKYVVLMVMDGLRRDMITEEYAPNVSAFRRHGVLANDVRTVFPSVTRVVSSSVATGAHPHQHGLFGNCIALFEDGGYALHNVGAPSFLAHWRGLRGRTLARPTLAERLAPVGAVRVFSNVSPGAAYMQDPDGHGFVYHRAGSFGPGGEPLPSLAGIDKGESGDAALTEMCLTFLESITPPPLSVLWLSEPDHSGHHNPLGSPAYGEALRAADECVGKVYRFLRARSEDDWLLLLCSDHGQETETECLDVARLLVSAGLKEDVDSREMVIAPNGSAGLAYIAPSCGARTSAVCNFFASQWWCGDIRFFPGDAGDFGAEDIPAFYFSMAKTSQVNLYNVPGTTLSVYDPDDRKERTGFGTHGGLGAYEQSPFFAYVRPGRQKLESVSGSVSLLDIAPIVLDHLGCSPEPREAGGVFLEAADND